MNPKWKYTSIIAICLLLAICGCGGGKKMLAITQVSEGTVGYNGALCLRTPHGLIIAHPSQDGAIIPKDTIHVPISASAALLDYNDAAKEIFFIKEDTIFRYDITTGLMRTMTTGEICRDTRCGRSSRDGKFFAFTSCSWFVGNIEFWRLVLVDAIEGGIVYYCDSLPAPDMFQWLKPMRLGFLEYQYVRGEFDTIGRMFDTERNAVLPARDGSIELMSNPCNPRISPDGIWSLDIIEGKPVIKKMKGTNETIGNP